MDYVAEEEESLEDYYVASCDEEITTQLLMIWLLYYDGICKSEAREKRYIIPNFIRWR